MSVSVLVGGVTCHHIRDPAAAGQKRRCRLTSSLVMDDCWQGFVNICAGRTSAAGKALDVDGVAVVSQVQWASRIPRCH